MKLKLLITALLVSAVAAAAPIETKPPVKNPIDREWLILTASQSGFAMGVDPKSFKVIKPGDEFSFDSLTIFGKDNFVNPPGLPPVAAHVTTIKASCSKKQAQIIADTLHDDAGKIVGTNEATKIDKMGPVEASSMVGKVIGQICSGKPLMPKQEQKKEQRGDSLKSA